MKIAVNIGFGGIASLILLMSKIVGLIDISWLWCVAPLLLSYAFTFIFLAMALFLTLFNGSDDND